MFTFQSFPLDRFSHCVEMECYWWFKDSKHGEVSALMPLFNILCFYTLMKPSGLYGSQQKTKHRKKQVEKKPAIDLRHSPYYTNPMQKTACDALSTMHNISFLLLRISWPSGCPRQHLLIYSSAWSHPITVIRCTCSYNSSQVFQQLDSLWNLLGCKRCWVSLLMKLLCRNEKIF